MKIKLMATFLALVAGTAFAEWPDWATPVEYLESAGVQEIKTDYMPYNASTIQADVEPLVVADNNSIFGAGDTDDHFNTFLRYSGSDMFTLRWRQSNRMTIAPAVAGTRYLVRLGGTVARVANQATGEVREKVLDNTVSTKTAGDSYLWLFACGDRWNRCQMKLYGAKIWESGTLVRDFRPCVSNMTGETKVAGLYDVVNDKFYQRYWSSSADFTYGPAKDAATTLRVAVTPERLASKLASVVGTATDLASGTVTNLTTAASATDDFGNVLSCTGCRIYEAVYDAASGEMTTGEEIEGSPFAGTSVAYTHGDGQRIAVWQYAAAPAKPISNFTGILEITAPTIDVEGRAKDLENVPVLVQLSGDIAQYVYDKMAFPATGADIAFYTMDGALLPHDIDTWTKDGVSKVWVKIPRLRTGEKFQMGYGCNDTTKYVAENPSAVWSDYQGVWHMDAADYVGEELMIADETGNGLSAKVRDPSVQTADAAGAIGGAFVSDTSSRRSPLAGFVVPNSQSLWDAGSFTISGWFKGISGNVQWGVPLFSTMDGCSSYASATDTSGGFTFHGRNGNEYGYWITSGEKYHPSVDRSGTSWFYFTFTYTSNSVSGGRALMYRNGSGCAAPWLDDITGYQPAVNDLGIGTYPGTLDSGNLLNWNGSVDEVRWSHDALSSVRVAQDYAMATDADYFAIESGGSGGPRTVEVTKYVTELGLDLDLPECHVKYATETNYTFVCSATRDRFYTKDDVAYECTGYTFTPAKGEAFSGSGTSFAFKPSEMGNGVLRWNFTRAGYRARVHNVPKFLEDYASVTVTPLDPEDHLFDVYYKVYAQLTVTLTEKVPGSFTRWYGAEASVVSNKTVTYQVLATANNVDLVPEVCGIVNTDDDTRLASDNCARVPATQYVYLKAGGDDAKDGLSAETAVATEARALAIAKANYAETLAQQVILVGAGTYSTVQTTLDFPCVLEGGLGGATSVFLRHTASYLQFCGWYEVKTDRAAIRRLCLYGLDAWDAKAASQLLVTAGTVEGAVITNSVAGHSVNNGVGAVQITGGVVTNSLITGCLAPNPTYGGTQGVVWMTGGALVGSRVTGGESQGVSAGYGGGICLNGGLVRNCLIDNNRAYTQGSGLYVNAADGGLCTVENCTIVDNTVVSGSSASPCGVYLNGSSATKNVVFVNNIVWGNSGNGEGEKDLCNLCRANTNYTYLANNLFNTALEENETTVDNVAGNPSFTDRAGGDYTIGRGAARNAGRTLAWAQDPLAVDLAGRARIQENVLDIGCYEHVPSTELGVTVTVTVPEGFKAGDLVSLAAEASGGAGDYTYDWYFGSTLVATGKNAETNVACTVYGRNDVTCVVTDADGKKAQGVEEGAIRLYVSKVCVAKGGSNTAPYDTWEKAADDFVAPMAILDSSKACEVLVGPGAYDVTNRIDFALQVNFHSSDGAAATVLRPAADVSLFACDGVGAGSVIDGFTVEGMSGAAIGLDCAKALGVTNLVFRNCSVSATAFVRLSGSSQVSAFNFTMSGVTNLGGALFLNGGSCNDVFRNLRVENCRASGYGFELGGAGFKVYNGLVVHNKVVSHLFYLMGGSLHNVVVDDCIGKYTAFSSNTAGNWFYLNNCIIGRFWTDDARTSPLQVLAHAGAQCHASCFVTDCSNGTLDESCLNATDPCFKRSGYYLRGKSPCVRAGDPQYYDAASVDLDGRKRLHATSAGYTVDMGCYENDVPGLLLLVK